MTGFPSTTFTSCTGLPRLFYNHRLGSYLLMRPANNFMVSCAEIGDILATNTRSKVLFPGL